jgi:L-serine dehydratase
MDVFDIIGPIMIGPSSSHTAGAVKLGNIARVLLGTTPVTANITLYGSFAKTGKGHGTDKALLAGICGFTMDDVKIKSIFDECPIEYNFEFADNNDYHPNTAVIELSDGIITINMRGASVGAGRVEIQEIDGMAVSFNGDYNTLIIFHFDQKGIIGKITTWLSYKGINIAYMKVFRINKGDKSVMVIETDQQVKDYKIIESFQKGLRVTYYENSNA